MTSASNYAKPPPLDPGPGMEDRDKKPSQEGEEHNYHHHRPICSTALQASSDYRDIFTPKYSTVLLWPECRLCCRERGHGRPHTSGAAAVADTGDKVGRGRHLDIVSTPATVCPAVLVCNHDRTTATGHTNSSGSYNKFDSEKPADEFSSHSRLHQTFF